MPRERWFYAKDMRRMGPLPKRQLLEALLALGDPRSCLIWRHGLPAWTPAREVPEIDRQLAPFAKVDASAARVPTLMPAGSPGSVADEGEGQELEGRPTIRPGGAKTRSASPNIALYFGSLAALVAVVVAGWLFWPRSDDPATATRHTHTEGAAPDSGRRGTARPDGAAPSPLAAGTRSAETEADADTPGFAGWSDQETDLAADELRRLRGVGGWSGNRLTITLYNGSTWRVTEILVRTSRLSGDEFVDGETPHRLLPVGGAPVDEGTAELLKKVAPDRKKPGVNPLDTGPFQATVGPQPPAYRWRIEGARGYPPRR
jgi:hypothetical protein